MKIKYLGHSAFLIKTNNKGILIDPYLDFSNEYKSLEKLKNENISEIFVTHAHNDHFGSAIEISKLTNAPIVAVFELGNFCLSKGCKAIPCALGGKLNLDFGSVTLVPAQHSSSFANGQYMGVACGLILEIEDKKLYHAGDTSLSNEMKMLSEYYSPDLSMLPVGGHFTMGIDEACYAAKILGSKVVIPMHYNSFPPIRVDINEFTDKITKQGQTPKVLESDEEFEF